jgi:hypothetical protein
MAGDWMCLLVPTQTAKTQFESRTKCEESKRRWKFFSNAMYGTHPPSTPYLDYFMPPRAGNLTKTFKVETNYNGFFF